MTERPLAEEEGIQIQPAKQEEDSLRCPMSWDKFIPDALGPRGAAFISTSPPQAKKELGINEQSECPSDGFIVTCTHSQYSRDCPGFAEDLSKCVRASNPVS